MLDADYFRGLFIDQLHRMDRTPTVKMHLQDGASVVLFTIEGIEPGYILVQAYPEDATHVNLDNGANSLTLKNCERHAIPYESILRVEFTVQSQSETPLGFYAGMTELSRASHAKGHGSPTQACASTTR